MELVDDDVLGHGLSFLLPERRRTSPTLRLKGVKNCSFGA